MKISQRIQHLSAGIAATASRVARGIIGRHQAVSEQRRGQAGVTILEALIGLLVLIGLIAYFGPVAERRSDDLINQSVAQHQTYIVKKAEQYIHDNYQAVRSASTSTNPAVITVAMLQSTGYVPTTMDARNGYGQTPVIYARQASPTTLETMVVTTGGEQISERDLRSIAKLQGVRGGYISTESPTVAQGMMSGWQTALSNFSISPGAGHLATALFFDSGAVNDDYLYRNVVPGHSELNEMNTNLGMRGNNINNAGQVSAKRVQTTEDVQVGTDLNVAGNTKIAGDTTTGGWFRTTGNGGWYSNKWGGGFYMSDPNWIRASNNVGITTGGEIKGGTVTSDGRLKTEEYLQLGGMAIEGASCSPNGLVGRTAAGLILSCQSGVWRSPGGVLTVNGDVCPDGYATASYYVPITRDLSQFGIKPTYAWQGHNYVYRCSGGGDRGQTCGEEQIKASQVKCIR